MVTPDRRGLQYGFGGEFVQNPQLDDYCQRVLGLLPNLELRQPLALLTSLENGNPEGTVASLTLRTNGRERTINVLPGLRSFQEYCQGNKIRGMIVVVPRLGWESIPPESFVILKEFFEDIGKVTDPIRYRVWIVDKDAADLPTEPKDETGKKKLADKKQLVGELGLAGVEYHHNPQEKLGWFEARPAKKRQIKERDYSGDERIIFLQKWMKMVIEYRGGRIISDSKLQEKLKHSKSYLAATQKISDARGIYSEEACGCLIHTALNGEFSRISRCEGENCFEGRKSRVPKQSFRLGEEYPISNCGDCQGLRTARAYWAEIENFDPRNDPRKGIKVKYEIICKDFSSHCKKDTVWVDPARVLNPMYIYSCLHPKKETKKAA